MCWIPGRTGVVDDRGFTVVEALVVLLLAGTVLGSFVSFLTGSTVWSARSTERALAQDELLITLERIQGDVRGAQKLVYPTTGKGSRPGIGVVNARGEFVFWRLMPNGTTQELVREQAGAPPETVMRDASKLVVTAVDLGPGREPRLARVILTRALRPGASDGATSVSVFGSAAVSAGQTGCSSGK